MSSSRPKPRASYQAQSEVAPNQYEANLPPLLLVLGTGGILIHLQRPLPSYRFRDSSRPVIERPYLESFLAYCLGVQTSCFDGKSGDSSDVEIDSPGPFINRPYGKQFWTETRMKQKDDFVEVEDKAEAVKKNKVPLPQIESSPFHIVVWTAAQIHNVNSNLTSIFGRAHEPPRAMSESTASSLLQPLSSHLLRVYDRKTLQPEGSPSYRYKTPNWKDLDIIWRALNTGDDSLLDAGERFEQENQKGESLEECVQTPWGPFNTLHIVADAADTHAQPHNVLLVPEFDGQAATLAFDYRRTRPHASVQNLWTSDSEDEGDGKGDPKGLAAQDDVLLQLVGVLEEARFQRNVSAWIRDGELGQFGKTENTGTRESAVDGGRGKSCEEWAAEGARVLREEGIAIRF